MTNIGFANPLGPSLTRAAGFGVLAAGAMQFDVTGMIARPIAGAIGGTVGSFTGPLTTVVTFGALALVYDWWIWPFLHQYV